MLYALAVTMTFLGCGDSLEDCEFISQSQKTYENHSICEEAIPSLLMKMNNTDYPIVTGHCSADIEPEIATSTQITDDVPASGPASQTEPTLLAPIDLSKQNQANGPASKEQATSAKPLKNALTRIENGFAYVRTGTTNLLTNIGKRTTNGLRKLAVGLKLRKEQPAQKGGV